MTKPENFHINTDYATLKNDDEATLSIVLPGSSVIAPGGTLLLTQTITIGRAGASERSQIHSSKEGVYWIGHIVSVARTGSALYNSVAELYRSSSTQLTAQVSVFNPGASALTTVAGDETFTFSFATFIPPFI